jgi:hypothetical protein
MPKLNDNSLEQHGLPTNSYGFSATRLDNLGASEYTLASVITDVSSSVSPFKKDLTKAVKEIIRACKYSPRADNLLVRLTEFSDDVNEIHGFKLLENCNDADYDNCLNVGGWTSLYDAAENGISATRRYAADLYNRDYGVNGIIFVLTDGGDNKSTLSAKAVHDELVAVVKDEMLESLVTVLIGVNVGDASISQYLRDLKTSVGFTQYVEIEKADASTMAKLAQFVSKSISAQSQSLGSGGASIPLNF